MIHTYGITGVTCNGCMASVKDKLMNLPNITNIETFLETKTIKISMEKLVAFQILQKALEPKYSLVKLKQGKKDVFPNEAVKQSELKQLFPLFLIFTYIITASILIHVKSFSIEGFMLDFMGLFYVVFSFFKFLDYKGFPVSFKMYDPLAKRIPAYGFIYPFVEFVLGLLFLTRTIIPSALIITIVILGITTVGVTNALLNKKAIKCACLGTALKLPMTKATFIENTIMIVMAVFMLIKICF